MSLLPAGFDALEPFVDQWAIDTAAGRAARRGASAAAEREAFYAAMQPVTGEALAHLDATPLINHDAAQRRLLHLCLSFAHVALAVEAQGNDEDRHTPHRNEMHITRVTSSAAPVIGS